MERDRESERANNREKGDEGKKKCCILLPPLGLIAVPITMEGIKGLRYDNYSNFMGNLNSDK